MVSETLKLMITADTAQARASMGNFTNFATSSALAMGMSFATQGAKMARGIEESQQRLINITKAAAAHQKTNKNSDMAQNAKIITQQDKIGVYSKSQTREAIAQARTFNIHGKQLDGVVQATMNLSKYQNVVYGDTVGTTMAAKELGKALGGNIGSLSRSGTLTKADVEMIKKKKDLTLEQKDMIDALNEGNYKDLALKKNMTKEQQKELDDKKIIEKSQVEIGKSFLEMQRGMGPYIAQLSTFFSKHGMLIMGLAGISKISTMATGKSLWAHGFDKMSSMRGGSGPQRPGGFTPEQQRMRNMSWKSSQVMNKHQQTTRETEKKEKEKQTKLNAQEAAKKQKEDELFRQQRFADFKKRKADEAKNRTKEYQDRIEKARLNAQANVQQRLELEANKKLTSAHMTLYEAEQLALHADGLKNKGGKKRIAKNNVRRGKTFLENHSGKIALGLEAAGTIADMTGVGAAVGIPLQVAGAALGLFGAGSSSPSVDIDGATITNAVSKVKGKVRKK